MGIVALCVCSRQPGVEMKPAYDHTDADVAMMKPVKEPIPRLCIECFTRGRYHWLKGKYYSIQDVQHFIVAEPGRDCDWCRE